MICSLNGIGWVSTEPTNRDYSLREPAGILTADVEMARRFIECGWVFAAVGSDLGILARGSEQLLASFRNQSSADSSSMRGYDGSLMAQIPKCAIGSAG
jgi:hypothetical protein